MLYNRERGSGPCVSTVDLSGVREHWRKAETRRGTGRVILNSKNAIAIVLLDIVTEAIQTGTIWVFQDVILKLRDDNLTMLPVGPRKFSSTQQSQDKVSQVRLTFKDAT